MEFKDLKKDCRYLFYRKDSNIKFRATFIDIIRYTLFIIPYTLLFSKNILASS